MAQKHETRSLPKLRREELLAFIQQQLAGAAAARQRANRTVH